MSPIKGLTDRHAKFPEIGRIRKGGAAPRDASGRTTRIGQDLTYFRVEFDEREAEAKAIFEKHYGTAAEGKPDEIDILLPFPSVEENFEAWREAYLAGGMIHRCDGEWVQYEYDPKRGAPSVKGGLEVDTGERRACDGSKPVLMYGPAHDKPLMCKPAGRLKALLPVLRRAAYVTVLTGSVYDIVHLSEQLEAYRLLGGQQGLVGIPLVLRRRPKEIIRPDPGTGERKRMTKSLLSIEADPNWVRQRLMALQASATPSLEPGAIMRLPASRAAVDEDEAIEGELIRDLGDSDEGAGESESEGNGLPVTPTDVPADAPSTSARPAASAKPDAIAAWPKDIIESLMAGDVLPKGTKGKEVELLLRYSPFEPGDVVEWLASWCGKYTAARTRAAQDGETLSALETAKRATAAWVNEWSERIDVRAQAGTMGPTEFEAWTIVVGRAEAKGLIPRAAANTAGGEG